MWFIKYVPQSLIKFMALKMAYYYYALDGLIIDGNVLFYITASETQLQVVPGTKNC